MSDMALLSTNSIIQMIFLTKNLFLEIPFLKIPNRNGEINCFDRNLRKPREEEREINESSFVLGNICGHFSLYSTISMPHWICHYWLSKAWSMVFTIPNVVSNFFSLSKRVLSPFRIRSKKYLESTEYRTIEPLWMILPSHQITRKSQANFFYFFFFFLKVFLLKPTTRSVSIQFYFFNA